jgi:hypothetical protein
MHIALPEEQLVLLREQSLWSTKQEIKTMMREKIPLGGCWFLFLEQFPDGADSGFLRQCIACDDCEGFFGAPLHALGTFGVLFAQITGVHRLGFGVQHHGAVVAGFNAPAAAVTLVLVNHDDAGFLRLRKGVTRACCYASGFFTESAGDSHVNKLVLANNTYAAFDGVESFLFGE